MCGAFAVSPCGFAGLVEFNFRDNSGVTFTYGVSVNIGLCAVSGSLDFLFLNHNRNNSLAVNCGFTLCRAVKGFDGVALIILDSIFVLSVVLGNLRPLLSVADNTGKLRQVLLEGLRSQRVAGAVKNLENNVDNL